MIRLLAFLMALTMAVPASAQLIIGHRGASGERPEHTLAAYALAVEQGADYIEPDLVPTRDGRLIARHENEISGTTNVADLPEFADRKTTKIIDGLAITGWFTEDFDLYELYRLRARERLPAIRLANTQYDGEFPLVTLEEIIAWVRIAEKDTGKRIGLYPELKHHAYFTSIGLDTVPLLLGTLRAAGYTGNDPVLIQSFEPTPLVQVKFRSDFRTVQLMSEEGGPADAPQLGYAQFLAPEGLKQVAGYAHAIGVPISLVLNEDGSPTRLVQSAHDAGLEVHTYTLRRENAFLPPALQVGDDPSAIGNFAAMWKLLVQARVDGVFTDNPGDAVLAKALR
ncbi:glycerophosphodiester phosphodiesterase family protein [Altererythrobacter aquiaggeris]|uniref:glycerophosphodiester phosphodiesterase family protein n=1 Tax=Aestuarierythrobacter aquiaggeris TaxID=1898396 RepID=UPI003018F753